MSTRRYQNVDVDKTTECPIVVSGYVEVDTIYSNITTPNLTITNNDIVVNERIYQQISTNPSYSDLNGFLTLSKNVLPTLDPISSGSKSVIDWVSIFANTSPSAMNWMSICWAPELGMFCAVANGPGFGGTINRKFMISYDGYNWIVSNNVTGPENDNDWTSVCWSSELGIFCTVATSGIGNRIITSSNGINWTIRNSPADYNWNSVCWSPQLGLFCAVASSGTDDRIMTSPNGISWNLRTSPKNIVWVSVCWADNCKNNIGTYGLFCAVARSIDSNNIMTSPDGINWTLRTNPDSTIQLTSVCYSSELRLFVAVSILTTKILISKDGITWTIITSTSINYNWRSVCWSPQLQIFVAVGDNNLRIMSSPDGVVWTLRSASENNSFQSICWSPELGIFASVCNNGTNRVMLSNIQGRPPTSYNTFSNTFNNIQENGLWAFQSFGRGIPVTYTSNFIVKPLESWIIANSASVLTCTLPDFLLFKGRELNFKTYNNGLISNQNNIRPLDGGALTNIILPSGAGNWATLVSNGSEWIITEN